MLETTARNARSGFLTRADRKGFLPVPVTLLRGLGEQVLALVCLAFGPMLP
jgi:hypothetical protein